MHIPAWIHQAAEKQTTHGKKSPAISEIGFFSLEEPTAV